MKKPKLEIALWIMFITMLVLYGIGARLLFSSVQHYAYAAQDTYGGDHVGALIALVKDEQAPYENRNGAIWALGQIGSDRALPILRELDTDEIQEPPYDSTSCIIQYGVEKSIRQINGFSMTRWIYRFL